MASKLRFIMGFLPRQTIDPSGFVRFRTCPQESMRRHISSPIPYPQGSVRFAMAKFAMVLAALRIEYTAPHDFLTAKAVGGFVTHDPQGAFVGLIDHLPNSAKREPGKIAAPKQAMDSWLSEQVSLLPRNLSQRQNILACYSLCHFDYDPIDVLIGILVIMPNGSAFWRLTDLSALLRGGNRLAFRVASYGDARHLERHGEQHTISGVATCYVLSGGEFNSAEISQNVPAKPNSLLGIIHRTLINQGPSPNGPSIQTSTAVLFSKCDCLEVRI